jgi:RNA polymerase sigma-70 factor (ECF subfamily)
LWFCNKCWHQSRPVALQDASVDLDFGAESWIERSKNMTVDLDAQLAATGDMEAFETIYRRYHGRVYTLCLRMIRNTTQAEDLTQEVFIQLFRKINTFRGDSSFTTWLHRLTVNIVLMHLRKPNVKSEQTTEDGTLPVRMVSGTENPSRMAVIDRISLDHAISQLAPGYRVVFILHDVEGYEHEQISRMLGCAVGTSKSQLHKARLKLRKLLTARKTDTHRSNNPGVLFNLGVHQLA